MKGFLLSALTSLLFGLSLNPRLPSLWFLAIFCIYFQYLVVREKKSISRVFAWTWFTQFLVGLTGFYWIEGTIRIFGNIGFPFSSLLFLGYSAYHFLDWPIAWCITYYITRRYSLDKKYSLLIVFPAIFSFLQLIYPKQFLWLMVDGWSISANMIQIASLVGQKGANTILIILASIFCYAMVQKKIQPKIVFLSIVTVLFVSIYIGGLAGKYSKQADLDQITRKDGKVITHLMVQGNIGDLWKIAANQTKKGKKLSQIVDWAIDEYITLTSKKLKETKERPDLIIWPENAFPVGVDWDFRRVSKLQRAIDKWKVPLITGAYDHDPLPAGHLSKRKYITYNTMFYFPVTGQGKIQKYRKRILIAFGEHIPLFDYFPQLKKWFPAMSHFSKGKKEGLIYLNNNLQVGVSLCYEAIFSGLIQAQSQHDVHYFINITNDSWFGNTLEPWQHLYLTRWRAVENGKYFIRVTNTGFSAFISPTGEIIKQIGLNQRETLMALVPKPKLPSTLYSKIGDMASIPIFLFYLLLLL